MNKPCTVPRCAEPAAGHSTHCENHKKTLRRHGHAQQAGITVQQLGPYLERMKARRAKNPQSDLWGILEARWEAIKGNAQAIAAKWNSGAPMVGDEARAADQVLRLSGNVPGAVVVDTVLAMYLMKDAEPRRFQSERAFGFQLVRRVRGLSEVNAGSYWDGAKGRSRKVYQDVRPRVVEVLAVALAAAFGGVGLTLAAREREEANKAQEDAQRLARALEELA